MAESASSASTAGSSWRCPATARRRVLARVTNGGISTGDLDVPADRRADPPARRRHAQRRRRVGHPGDHQRRRSADPIRPFSRNPRANRLQLERARRHARSRERRQVHSLPSAPAARRPRRHRGRRHRPAGPRRFGRRRPHARRVSGPRRRVLPAGLDEPATVVLVTIAVLAHPPGRGVPVCVVPGLRARAPLRPLHAEGRALAGRPCEGDGRGHGAGGCGRLGRCSPPSGGGPTAGGCCPRRFSWRRWWRWRAWRRCCCCRSSTGSVRSTGLSSPSG